MGARSLSLPFIHSTSICWVVVCVRSHASPHKSITNALYFKELGRRACCLCPKNRQSQKQTNKPQTTNKQKQETCLSGGSSVRGWNFLGSGALAVTTPGCSSSWGGRMEIGAPGLPLPSVLDVMLIKSFPENVRPEPQFPIFVSEKWGSCRLSRTLRADTAHFECKKLRLQPERGWSWAKANILRRGLLGPGPRTLNSKELPGRRTAGFLVCFKVQLNTASLLGKLGWILEII